VTHLIALAALDTLRRARLVTILGVVAFLFAILASVGVDSLLGTVASPVTLLGAVHAGYSGRHGDVFGLLLLAVLEAVSYILEAMMKVIRIENAYLLDMSKLSTVAADWNPTVFHKSGRGKTLLVLFGVLRPTFPELRTARLV
jgi:hypothetical protein